MPFHGTVRAYHEAISRYGIELSPDNYTVISTPNTHDVELGNVLEWTDPALGERLYRNVTRNRDIPVTVLHHGVVRADLHERMGGY